MSNGAPLQLPEGPPAEVYIYVLPPASGGCHSLGCYPRRKGDTKIYFTRPGCQPTPGRAREVMWIPSGLLPGQALLIQEKITSPSRGHFPGQPFRILPGQPFKLSGPAFKGPQHGRDSTWVYEIILSDASGVLARLDPPIDIPDDP